LTTHPASEEIISQIEGSLELTQELARKCKPDIELNKNDLNNWIFGSLNENTQLLTDDEIIEEVTVDVDQQEDNQNIISQQRSVTNNDAMNTLNTIMTWAEENEVMNEELLMLKRMQEGIIELMFDVKKQKIITNYFKPV